MLYVFRVAIEVGKDAHKTKTRIAIERANENVENDIGRGEGDGISRRMLASCTETLFGQQRDPQHGHKKIS